MAETRLTNETLVDSMKERGVLEYTQAEAVFRLVPRSSFVPAEAAEEACVDRPILVGHLHISAPHIYAMLIEKGMSLGPGMRFLALGSGSGYLCALVSRFLGPNGVIHGVEYHEDNVKSARSHYEQWRSSLSDPKSSAPAEFVCGNCFALDPSRMKYDRVYIGAGCSPSRKQFFMSFLAPGGVLVVPCEGAFLRIARTPTGFEESVLCQVSFAPLIDLPIGDPSSSSPPRFSGGSLPHCGTVPQSGTWRGHFNVDGRRAAVDVSLNFGHGCIAGNGTCDGSSMTISCILEGRTVAGIAESQALGGEIELRGFYDSLTCSFFGTWSTVASPSAVGVRFYDTVRKGEWTLVPGADAAPLILTVRFEKSGVHTVLDGVAPSTATRDAVALACSKCGVCVLPTMSLEHAGVKLPAASSVHECGLCSGALVQVTEA